MASELEQLQRGIADAERKVEKKKVLSGILLGITVLTLGMGAVVTIPVGVGTAVSFKDLDVGLSLLISHN